MTVIATALKHLMAAGLTGEALVAAIEEIENEVAAQRPIDESAARRREKDRAYQANKRAERRQNRQISADSADDADAVPKERHSNLSSEPKGSSEDTNPARKANPFPRPEWAEPQVWSDFLANRRKRRMTNSATAYSQFLSDVERIADDEWPPGRLLAYAAGKGWGSINDPREKRNGRSDTLGRNQPSDGLSPTTRAAAAVFGTAPASFGH